MVRDCFPPLLLLLLLLLLLVRAADGLAFWNGPMKTAPPPRTIAVTGSTGLVGSALCERLSRQPGTTLRRLTTGRLPNAASTAPNEEWYRWDPRSGALDPNVFKGCDAVVHLAGENIASGSWESPFALLGSWTAAKKTKILQSRVEGTRLVVDTINGMTAAPRVLLTASAVGYYGFSNNARVFTEEFGQGDGFLAGVVREWESEALRCTNPATRTVCARLGVVLSEKGGVVAKLLPLFRLAAGGNLGSGKQGFSWVTLDDAVSALEFLLLAAAAAEGGGLTGPVNVCAPGACTNADFTRALAAAVNRPAIVPLPAVVGNAIFGEFGQEVLFGGQKAIPARLAKAGFKFAQPEIGAALESLSL